MHLRTDAVKVYYLLADHPAPSWGAGMMYEHVALLREAGIDAQVLHFAAPFRPSWLELDVPLVYADDPEFAPIAGDIVVVPEVLAADPLVRRHPWRRIVFVQGSFLIVRGLGGAIDYRELGYESAMAVLPHVADVVERHFGLTASVVPPFVAPYFFAAEERRERRVLFDAKPGYRAAGVPDHAIAATLLERELASRGGWSFQALENLSHREVAALMKRSMFLVNVNSHEAFNTTVPEAMAAGCVPVCYEATGGRDFLRDGENAIVFANQDVYALVERVLDLVDRFEESAAYVAALRRGGAATAARFSRAATGESLRRYFASLR